MNEEEKINEEYRQYQFGTQGIDIWEEGAFRAGWEAAKKFFKPDVEDSIDKQKCGHEFVSKEFLGQSYGTCMSCGRAVFD